MALLICKFCGGELDITNGATVAQCKYCHTLQTLPKTTDEGTQSLFNRANTLRRRADFDKAEAVYEKIVEADSTESEAYWGLVLCKYGIEYVEDPATGKMIPTCHRASYDSALADDDYKSAIEYADEERRVLYEAQAKEIDRIQKDILALSQNEETYDVFICYKETDENGKRTRDSVIANDIYYQLTEEGFKVFYAAITLEGKLGSAYEPIIFAALNSAKVMLAIGTKPEYYNSVWVKNEWSRYLKIIKKDRNKLLIPCYRDMDAYDLPDEFAHLQAQDMSKIGFITDLIRGIKKVMEKFKTKPTVIKETIVKEPTVKETVIRETVVNQPSARGTVVTGGGANTAPLLKRVFAFLEDGDFESADEYCERVLDIELENAEAYLGKLMAELKVKKREELKNSESSFEGSANYKKALRYGTDALKNELKGYIQHINERSEEAKKELVYLKAMDDYKSYNVERLQSAIRGFSSISGFKDSTDRIRQCEEKLARLREKAEAERIEKERKAEEKRKVEAERAEAERVERERQAEEARIEAERRKKRNKKIAFISVPVLCAVLAFVIVLNAVIIPNNKYGNAVALMNDGKYTEAIALFEALDGYKDSSDKMSECKISAFIAENGQAVYDMWGMIEAGDHITFGTYEQDNNTSNGEEAIEWLVLDVKGGKALVISKYALDCRAFHNKAYTDVTWETCTLRTWLNDEFLNSAFSDTEKAMIPVVTVAEDNNSADSGETESSTQDKVFLLSEKEALAYLVTANERICKPTKYAESNGANSGSIENAWWLRTMGRDQTHAAYVTGSGTINLQYTYSKLIAVRPALWIDLTLDSSNLK